MKKYNPLSLVAAFIVLAALAFVGYLIHRSFPFLGHRPPPPTNISKISQRGLKELEERAMAGDPKAQLDLGVRYQNGDGVERNYQNAIDLFKKAGNQGYSRAYFNLGVTYLNGTGVPSDPKAAVEWFRKSADSGFDRAQMVMGQCYLAGTGVPRDDHSAMLWYEKAAQNGNADARIMVTQLEAMALLGMTAKGEADRFRSAYGDMFHRKEYQKEGQVIAVDGAGYIYHDGAWVSTNNPSEKIALTPIRDDMTEARKPMPAPSVDRDIRKRWESALRGDLKSKGQLEEQLVLGDASIQRQILYLREKDGNSDAAAAMDLGWRYFNGYGVTPNLFKANVWFTNARTLGNPLAGSSVGMVEQLLRGPKPDPKNRPFTDYAEHLLRDAEAVRLYRTIAKPTARPPAVYQDSGACPFECCTYGDWKVVQETVVYDRIDGKPIGKLHSGDQVRALSGQVDITPGVMVVTGPDTAASTDTCHRGDVFYVLTSQGEGVMKIWSQGKITEENPQMICQGRLGHVLSSYSSWWAIVQLPNGRRGWVPVQRNFSGMDACS